MIQATQLACEMVNEANYNVVEMTESDWKKVSVDMFKLALEKIIGAHYDSNKFAEEEEDNDEEEEKEEDN